MFKTFRPARVAVAVEGCCHGDLDAIYSTISSLEAKNKYKVDLLLICGDFQAVRNYADLECLATPPWHRKLKDFYKYYSGEKAAPIPTIVIGGNHEASNYMQELHHGGWLAPNLYFLGHAGSVIANGIRISGASGIFAPRDYRQGLYEKLPYDKATMKSIYHTREFSVRQLSLLPKPQIFMSHDWPVDITSFGTSHPTPNLSLKALLKARPHFKKDIDAGSLGSQPAMSLLKRLKPEWWFSGHMHIRFDAMVVHEADGSVSQPGIHRTIPLPDSDVASLPGQPSATRFLALDKCGPGREFLEVFDISPPSPGSEPSIPTSTYASPTEERQPVSLCFDPHWLAITRAFQPYLSTTRTQKPLPASDKDALARVGKELEWVLGNVPKKLGVGGSESWEITRCQEFKRTAPVERNPGNGQSKPRGITQPRWCPNPQTKAFCEMLEIEDRVAVEGCCHGDLDTIYSAISNLEAKNNYKVDLLLICGDFQAVRNYADLQCMACPQKYKALKDFYKYYSGEKTAPIPTIVIGGNHEAANYMHELYHGGWLAPNIYFLGNAGSIIVNGIRISGVSGILGSHDFKHGHYEKLPYNKGTMRSIYHTREFSIRRLSLLPRPQVFLSHDWPLNITSFGTSHATPDLSLAALLRIKPHFRESLQSGTLGSETLMGLLKHLKPEWWFSAHMHVRFEAKIVHGGDSTNSKPTKDRLTPVEIRDLFDDDDELPVQPEVPITTRFLALDKCLPRRQFLEVVDISPPPLGSDPSIPDLTYSPTAASSEERQPLSLCYDPHWLAVTRAFQPYLSTAKAQKPPLPKTEKDAAALVEKELDWVLKNVPKKLGAVGGSENASESWEIHRCQVFEQTAPVEENPGDGRSLPQGIQQPPWYPNPQTKAFCGMLEIEDRVNKHQASG